MEIIRFWKDENIGFGDPYQLRGIIRSVTTIGKERGMIQTIANCAAQEA
jgi:hypothetical protein